MFDLIVRGASVVDGTGAPARPADLGVIGDRIAALGAIEDGATAARTIDARGRVACPGFIDIHTHSDLTLVADGTGESKLRQGVTTEVVGNCSFSAFPIEPARRDLHADHLARATAPLTPWWTDLDGYADALHERGLAINVAPLAGHGTLRVAAMGVDERAPTPAELSRMEQRPGARPRAGRLRDEHRAHPRAERVRRLRRGGDAGERVREARRAYATHCRAARPDERAAVAEAIELGRQTGVTVEFSHLAINRPERWGHGAELLAMFETARDDGVDIFFDVYPYDASSSSLTQYLPSWVQAGGTEAMVDRLADPDGAPPRARRHGARVVRRHPVAVGQVPREQLPRRLRSRHDVGRAGRRRGRRPG